MTTTSPFHLFDLQADNTTFHFCPDLSSRFLQKRFFSGMKRKEKNISINKQ
jgi:hypothetical protein